MQDKEGKDDTYAAPRLKLSINDFEFVRVLGEGSMATVFHAVLTHSVGDHPMLQAGAECAMKVVDKFYIQRHKMSQSVIRERYVMDKLQTSWTVPLKYTFQDDQKIYMALELYKGGDLFDQLQLRKPLPIDEARFYAAEMVLMLECLRDYNVVFRDFKPENMILDSSGHLRLTDFGCAKILTTESSSAQLNSAHQATSATPADGAGTCPDAKASFDSRKVTFVGTADYLSPEVLKNTGCSFAVDLWGFGCVLFQLIAGVPPFRDSTAYLIMQRIDALQYEFPEEFNAVAKDLVSQLLVEEPSERLGSDDLAKLKEHAFFAGIDWSTLRESEAPQCAPVATKSQNVTDADLWEMRGLQDALPDESEYKQEAEVPAA